MAAYDWDVTTDEVLEAVGHPNPTTPSQPNAKALGAWIKRFAGQINAALIAIGVTPSSVTTSSDDDFYQACRHQVIARAGAQWTMHNQHDVPESARVDIDEFNDFLRNLRQRPTHLTASTAHSIVPSTGPERNSQGDLVNTSSRNQSAWSRSLRREGFG